LVNCDGIFRFPPLAQEVQEAGSSALVAEAAEAEERLWQGWAPSSLRVGPRRSRGYPAAEGWQRRSSSCRAGHPIWGSVGDGHLWPESRAGWGLRIRGRGASLTCLSGVLAKLELRGRSCPDIFLLAPRLLRRRFTYSRCSKSRGDSVKSMGLKSKIGPWPKSVRLMTRTREKRIFLW
jgi:hypothetical protein